MSQHPSLRSSDKDKQHRSVLKRYERLKLLKDKEKWDDKKSVFGLQKVRVIRFKIKKEKAAVAEGAEAEAAAPGIVAPAAAGAAKQGAPAKGAAATPAKDTAKAQKSGDSSGKK